MAARPTTAEEALAQFQATGQYWDPLDLAMRGTSQTGSPEQTLAFLKTRYVNLGANYKPPAAPVSSPSPDWQGQYDQYGQPQSALLAAQHAGQMAPTIHAPAGPVPLNANESPVGTPGTAMTPPPTAPGAGWSAMTDQGPDAQFWKPKPANQQPVATPGAP